MRKQVELVDSSKKGLIKMRRDGESKTVKLRVITVEPD